MAQDKGWPGEQLEVMSLPYIEVYWSCSEPAHSSYTRSHQTTTSNCTQERSRVLEGGMTDYAWQWHRGNLLANCQPRQLSLYCFVMAAYYWSLMYTEGVRLPPRVGSTIYLQRGRRAGQEDAAAVEAPLRSRSWSDVNSRGRDVNEWWSCIAVSKHAYICGERRHLIGKQIDIKGPRLGKIRIRIFNFLAGHWPCEHKFIHSEFKFSLSSIPDTLFIWTYLI